MGTSSATKVSARGVPATIFVMLIRMNADTTRNEKSEIEIQVESEAGPGGMPRPTRFYLGAQWHDIAEVLDCWLGEDLRYFKVRTDDAHVYILRQAPEDAAWSLTLFSREEYWKGTNDASYSSIVYHS